MGNVYLEETRAPVQEEVTATDLAVTGEIPEELEGRWLRNGPNPRGVVDPATHHWFLGDGMIHGVRLRGGRAEWYRNRWVRGVRMAAELGEDPPTGSSFGDRDFGPNTAVGGYAGKTWAMVEAGTTPMTLTYDLDTIGYDGFDATLPGGFTAHPKYDPATGELHGVCYAYPDQLDRVQHVVIGSDGRMVKVTEIPIDGMPMIHDMSLTTQYVLVYDLPLVRWLWNYAKARDFTPLGVGNIFTHHISTPHSDSVSHPEVGWCRGQRFKHLRVFLISTRFPLRVVRRGKAQHDYESAHVATDEDPEASHRAAVRSLALGGRLARVAL